MNTHQKINKAKDNLLMISMFSIVMLFAGLTSAYIVSKGALDTKWDVIKLSNMFYFSTICIISSSVFAQLALNSSKNDNDYWEVMNDNNIIDFIRREPDSLVIYTLEEYSRLCKDTISATDSDTDSMYEFDYYSD